MQLDTLNRGLLGVVLLLTLLLLVQRMVFPFGALDPAIAAELGRYEFRILRFVGNPMLLKIDTDSGAIWKRGLEADGPWARLNDEVVLAEPAPPATSPVEGRSRPMARWNREAVRGLQEKIAEMQGIDLANLPEDLSVLTNLVRSGIPVSIRGWALKQISGYPPKDAVPALVPLLDHPDRTVLVGVVEALKLEGDPAAIEPLRVLLKTHRNGRVRQKAAAAIKSLEDEAAKLAS